jgi:hypothetical protein
MKTFKIIEFVIFQPVQKTSKKRDEKNEFF